MTEASHAALAAARDIAQTFAFYDEKSFTEADIAQIAAIIAKHHPAPEGEIAALRAECAALRSAAEGLDHFAWSAVMADCEEARQGLQGRIDRLRATLTPGAGESALRCVREMQGAIAATLAPDKQSVYGTRRVISSLASAEESARRLFGEPQA